MFTLDQLIMFRGICAARGVFLRPDMSHRDILAVLGGVCGYRWHTRYPLFKQ